MLFLITLDWNWLLILYVITDLIIGVWSIGRSSSVLVERCSSVPRADRLEAELSIQSNRRSTGEIIWRPPWGTIKLDPIRIRNWVFWRDEKHKARPAEIWRRRCPRFTATHGCHEGPPRGQRGEHMRARTNQRRSQAWAKEARKAQAEQERLGAEARAEQELLQRNGCHPM